MSFYYRLAAMIVAVTAFTGFSPEPARAEIRELQTGAFEITQRLVLPGAPETIYDAITGDISEWWDHTFSQDPLKLYVETKPGGGFWEIFDESGDGVRHATVIYAHRGKVLRFEGPLGLSGRAIQMVHTYTFSHVGTDSTALELTVHGSGEIEPGLAETVEGVWLHFLVEQFKPYIESGRHLDRK
jgi:hypothetical protein